jgi:tetratricopeptide (TPR) repeat protein
MSARVQILLMSGFLRLGMVTACLWFTTSHLHAHGDLHARIEAISQSIQSNSTNAELFLRRGELFRLHNETELAIADFKRARELNPRLELAALCMGRAWSEAGKPAQAKPLLDEYLTSHPDSAEALLFRARTLAALGQRRLAAVDYSGALAAVSTPLPDIYLERARIQAQEGLIDEAIAGLDAGTARIGPVAPLELLAIEFELSRKRYDAALHRLDAQILRAPRKEFLLCRRGAILEQAGRLGEARASYQAAAGALETLPPERQATGAVGELARQIRAALARLPQANKTAAR